MTKRVLILVGIPSFDYSNPHSAVASFLSQIKLAANENGWIAEFPPQSLTSKESNTTTQKQSKLKQILNGWKWAYQSLAFYRYQQNQKALFKSLSQLPKYDKVIEFHTVGSTIGKQLANHWKAKLSVIFDSPVDEQFLEMKQTRTAFWKSIQKSEQVTMEGADHIMAYSPACSEYLKKRYALKTEPHILPCVVHKRAPINESLKERFNILFIGSFLSWHNVGLLVKAFERLVAEKPEARLQLIGYGEEWQKIKKMIVERQLTSVVELPGFVSEKDLLQYKKEASIGVMPGSNWYGSPLKLFEYAAAGIPFIAPDTPTVRSIFTEEEHCLYITDKEPINSLYNGLNRLMDQPEIRQKIGIQAREFVNENFGHDLYLLKLSQIL
jgi:glycosyltransferase involved in cell wall biosynthesis